MLRLQTLVVAATLALSAPAVAQTRPAVAAAPIIEGLLQSAPEAIAVSKHCAMSCAGALIDDAQFADLVALHSAKRQSAEAAEGLASFAQKRAPSWSVRS